VINRRNGFGTKFESLSPNPIRRDKPAQRFRHNGFGTTVLVKLFLKKVVLKRADLGNKNFLIFSGFSVIIKSIVSFLFSRFSQNLKLDK
jgi:hypothetical protein